MPVNTAYLNTGPGTIGHPSQFTVALTAQTVTNAATVESSFSIPARLVPLGGRPGLAAGDPIFVGPDSAVSDGLTWCAYSPGANTVTLRFGMNDSSAGTLFSIQTVVQRAGTWGFAYYKALP